MDYWEEIEWSLGCLDFGAFIMNEILIAIVRSGGIAMSGGGIRGWEGWAGWDG